MTWITRGGASRRLVGIPVTLPVSRDGLDVNQQLCRCNVLFVMFSCVLYFRQFAVTGGREARGTKLAVRGTDRGNQDSRSVSTKVEEGSKVRIGLWALEAQ